MTRGRRPVLRAATACVLLLTGCATATFDDFRHELRRHPMSLSALGRCVGETKRAPLPDGTTIETKAQAAVKETGVSSAPGVSFMGFGFSLGALSSDTGSEAIFAVDAAGHVVDVACEGAGAALTGRNGACAPQVAACLDIMRQELQQ